MKRPLVFAAGGFVLGEVWLLLPVEMKAVVPVLVMAGIFCLWMKRRERGCVDASGRSLVRWFLPFFFFALLGAGRLWADERLSARCGAQIAALEGAALRAEGTLDDVGAGKEGSYAAVLTLSDVVLYARGEAREFEGDVLVYLDEAPAGLDLGGAGTDAGDGRTEERADAGGGNESGSRKKTAAPAGQTVAADTENDAARTGGLRVSMRVSVWGELETMGRATNPGQFDFGKYYHALGIEGRMFGENLQAAGDEYSPYLDGIFRLKCWAGRTFARLCGADSGDAGVFTAVVLGDKTALASDVKELYQKNGIAHLLAVSGLHISLIGMGLYRLLRRRLGMKFELAGVLAAAVTVSYGILTGGSASVVRAVVMVCLQILADKLGRTYDLLSAMALAAVLLLTESPSLLFQAGFQLSFGAVLAIGAVYPVLEEWTGVGKNETKTVRGEGHGGGNRLGQTVLLGMVIQVVTLPVTAYHFYEYPVYGIVLNLLVIPLMGYVLVSGLAGIALGAVWLPAGRFAVGTGHYILRIYEWLCRVFEELPGAVQIVGQPRMGQIIAYAAVWSVVLLWAAWCAEGERQRGSAGEESDQEIDGKSKKIYRRTEGGGKAEAVRPERVGRAVGAIGFIGPVEPVELAETTETVGPAETTEPAGPAETTEPVKTVRIQAGPDGEFTLIGNTVRRLRLAMLAACACAGYLLLQALPAAGLRVTFLDVGQGDGSCFESGEMVILVDGGSTSEKSLGDQVLEPYLKSRGISRIDYAVVSHGDEDHISGLRYLLESDCGITVGTLILPQLAKGDEKYGELERLAGAAGTNVVWMKAGDRIGSTGYNLQVTCLYAGDPGYREDTNDHSLLLEVSYGKAGILLTGDMSAEGERRWLEGVRESGEALGLGNRIQLLKVAHHGSRYSSSSEFLEYVDPDWAVISCGANNRYGHPGEDTLERLRACGARTFLTMDGGAVIVDTDGEMMTVRTFLGGK